MRGRSSGWNAIEEGKLEHGQVLLGAMTRGRLLLTGFLIALAVWVFVYKAAPKMPDFEVYWKAASRAAHAEPLYRTSDGHFQFKYLPAFAVLAIPIGLLPLATAELVWFAASVALLVALVAMAIRLPVERRMPLGWLAFITVISFLKFYAHELVLGQVNILFAVVATGALLAMKARHEVPAGVLVALAIVIKPYAVLFLPWLLARRRLPSIAAACAGLAVVLAARLAYATALILLCVAAFIFLKRRGVTFPEGVEGAVLLTLMPLLSPQGWDYVFLIATPAIVFLVNYRDRLPRPMRVAMIAAVATIAFSLFDLMGRTAYYAFMRMSFISLCFFVVIAALATLRLRKIA
jgi:hypothetical protein